jgi:EAL domain-containing protein (putative c-di-GMP-specific phosphodiesterase class I)
VALDEFGGRANSLRILRYLPLDAVKINGRAIAAVEHSRHHHAALAAIVAAARFLDLQTVAKSVECAEVLPMLKALGVDYAQGYGIAKPAPLNDA